MPEVFQLPAYAFRVRRRVAIIHVVPEVIWGMFFDLGKFFI
jgi:hypothetical protein